MLRNNMISSLAAKFSMAGLFFVMVFVLAVSSAPVSADDDPEFVDLGNLVWYDSDFNGLQDVGESGVPFIPVILYEVPNTVVGSTLTDANGFYEFTDFPAGNYYIQFVLPNGYVITMQNAGSNDLIDSDVDQNGYTNGIVFNNDNEMDETIDLGVYWNLDNQAVFCDGIDFLATDWQHNLGLTQFNDPQSNNVYRIDIFSYASISQDIYAENLDPVSGADLEIQGTGEINYTLPAASPVSNVMLSLSQSYAESVTAYDGNLDYAGTSGVEIHDLVAYNTVNTTLFTGFDAFLGTGTLTVPVTADGETDISGSGNLAGYTNTVAYAGICVTYYYAEPLAVTMSAISAKVETDIKSAFLAVALMPVTLIVIGAYGAYRRSKRKSDDDG